MLKAREWHMACAALLRWPMGFGAKSRLHAAKVLRPSADLPTDQAMPLSPGGRPLLRRSVARGA